MALKLNKDVYNAVRKNIEKARRRQMMQQFGTMAFQAAPYAINLIMGQLQQARQREAQQRLFQQLGASPEMAGAAAGSGMSEALFKHELARRDAAETNKKAILMRLIENKQAATRAGQEARGALELEKAKFGWRQKEAQQEAQLKAQAEAEKFRQEEGGSLAGQRRAYTDWLNRRPGDTGSGGSSDSPAKDYGALLRGVENDLSITTASMAGDPRLASDPAMQARLKSLREAVEFYRAKIGTPPLEASPDPIGYSFDFEGEGPPLPELPQSLAPLPQNIIQQIMALPAESRTQAIQDLEAGGWDTSDIGP